MWLQLPRSLDPLAVYEEALRRGVLVSPSPVSSVATPAEPALRLAFCGESAERVAEGARRLAVAIKHLLSRTRGEPPGADADPILEVV
jgi:DNA-binding transcriptional MocR family regulator